MGLYDLLSVQEVRNTKMKLKLMAVANAAFVI